MTGETGKCELCPKISSLRCSFCPWIFYCSKEHQKQDWKRHKPICTKPKFEIRQNEHLVRHLIAAEKLKLNQIVLKEKPILLGPKIGTCTPAEGQTNTILFCLGCYRELSESDSAEPECSRCRFPICSPACSQEYWHSNFECRFFREGQVNPATDVSSQESVYNKVSVIQSLIYFRSILLNSYYPKDFTTLLSLQSHTEVRQDLPYLEKTTRVYEDFKKVMSEVNHPSIDMVPKPQVHQIIGVIDTNGLEIATGGNCNLLGIYPTFSLMEHSCCPNTKVYFVPAKKDVTKEGCHGSIDLFVRTTCSVEPGCHLATTHTNLLWNTEKRREDLQKRRHFYCACPRCEDPTELGSNFSTIRCPSPDCTAYSVPVAKNSGGHETHWECQSCGKVTESWQVAKVDKRLAEMVSRLKPDIGHYRELRRAMDDLVHPSYYLNFVVNHSLVQLFGKDDLTRNDKEVLDEKIKICNSLLGSLKAIDPGLGSCHLYAAVVYYELQSAFLGIVGGEGENDFGCLRNHPESVKLAIIYLRRCLECFQYEYFQVPENKLKLLAEKKMEYLNMIVKHFKK